MRLIDADVLKTQIFEKCNGRGYMWTVIMGLIDKAPVIQPAEPQWIPVMERLPECGEHYVSNDVLVSVDYRPDDPDETKDTFVSIDHVCFNCFKQGVFSIERDNPYDTEPSPYFVNHWMPLPEPYAPEMEENT